MRQPTARAANGAAHRRFRRSGVGNTNEPPALVACWRESKIEPLVKECYILLEVVPFQEEHLEDAAVLASVRYEKLCGDVPSLPSRYAQVDTLLPLLRQSARAAPGVAAIRGRRLVGFLTAWRLPSFRGQRSMFSPEWANAADLEDSRRIYEEMYFHVSASWVADGCFTHLISVLPNDGDGIRAWHWLGFGMIAADAVRDLRRAPGGNANVDIRRAGPQDLAQVIALSEALEQHLTGAPTFLVATGKRERDDYEEWLCNPARALWLAFRGAEAVAFIALGPASEEACTIIVDEKTSSISGAFTREEVRGMGIATALLNRSLQWARGQGYARCHVDFEPMNPWATRFWLRHFQPVSYTLARQIDPRVGQVFDNSQG